MDQNVEDYREYLQDQIDDHLGADYDKLVKYCDDFVAKTGIDPVGKNILDLGCREFHPFQYFREKYSIEIIGIDVGTEGHEYARGLKRPSIWCDAHDMSMFNTGFFDAILSIHVLEHMYDLDTAVTESARILKSGGFFYIAVPFPCQNLKKGHWQEITDTNVFDSHFTPYFDIVYSAVSAPGDSINLRGEGEYFLILKKK